MWRWSFNESLWNNGKKLNQTSPTPSTKPSKILQIHSMFFRLGTLQSWSEKSEQRSNSSNTLAPRHLKTVLLTMTLILLILQRSLCGWKCECSGRLIADSDLTSTKVSNSLLIFFHILKQTLEKNTKIRQVKHQGVFNKRREWKKLQN